ncbi:hypothetical protein GGI20_002698 [Coemansia sp. BCRC 34301]|nr:hypothetical protein GGI20_002698 [Coemansia sp. BCRC 34301]
MLLAIAAHSVVGEDVEDSDDISQLLGMRPDLADALDGSDANISGNLPLNWRVAKDEAIGNEAVLKRTQKCNQDCHNEPEELMHMCIQRCSYYMADPVRHKLDYKKTMTVDSDGLLVANEHLRTRVRLMGPDGLPLLATDAAAAAVPSIPGFLSAGVRGGSSWESRYQGMLEESSWESRYRVVLINSASRHRLFAALWIMIVAIVL